MSQASKSKALANRTGQHQQATIAMDSCLNTDPYLYQGCISCGILVSGIGARGVSSEHMENMEMFSCSPT